MPEPLIRRLDQAVIAALTLVCLLGVAAWCVREGALREGLVEIDNAPPRDYRFLVDVNAAEWPELAQLPGIGQTLAERIVATREAVGGYRTVDELRRVEGIGPRKLEGLRRYVLPLPDDGQVAGDALERGPSG